MVARNGIPRDLLFCDSLTGGIEIGVHRETVYLWRERWAADWEKLCAIEAKQPKDKKFMDSLLEFFSDKPRSGAPTTFSAEALCQIIAVACEKPAFRRWSVVIQVSR